MDFTEFPFRDLDEGERDEARLVLKNLMPLLPEDAADAFIAADENEALIVHKLGPGWRFGAGVDPFGDWTITTHTEYGQALLETPEGESKILRTGWHPIPPVEDVTTPEEIGDHEKS